MPKIATVLVDGLELRTSVPSGKAIAELTKGEKVLVLDSKHTTTVMWLWVRRSDGCEGYIAEKRFSASGSFVRFAKVVDDPCPPDVPSVGDHEGGECNGDPLPPNNSPFGGEDYPTNPQVSHFYDNSTVLLGCLSAAFIVALIAVWAFA